MSIKKPNIKICVLLFYNMLSIADGGKEFIE